MSDYPMLISNKLHSFRNFLLQRYEKRIKHANFIQEQGRIESFICNDTKRHPSPISLSLNAIKQTGRLI